MTPISQFDLQQMQQRTQAAINPKAAAEKLTKAREKHAAGQERELTRLFCAYLTQRGVPHVVSTFGRKGTIASGWPDVTALYAGRCCCVELKVAGGVVSREQAKCHIELNAAGVPVAIVFNLQDAIAFVKTSLNL